MSCSNVLKYQHDAMRIHTHTVLSPKIVWRLKPGPCRKAATIQPCTEIFLGNFSIATGNADTTRTVAHQNQPIISRQRLHKFHQRLKVVRQRTELVQLPWVDPRSSHVQRRNPMTRGSPRCCHLVPTPCSMTGPMNQLKISPTLTQCRL